MTTEGRKPANLVRLTWPALGCAACLVPLLLSTHGWWPENRVASAVGAVSIYAFFVYPWALAVYLLLP
jgi:hypothetical protein